MNPREIEKFLDRMPPGQRNERRKLVGVRVKWIGHLSGTDQLARSKQRLHLLTPRQASEIPRLFSAIVDSFPDLDLLEEGTEMTIEGTIKTFIMGVPQLEPTRVISHGPV
jgi:hypothetical protein